MRTFYCAPKQFPVEPNNNTIIGFMTNTYGVRRKNVRKEFQRLRDRTCGRVSTRQGRKYRWTFTSKRICFAFGISGGKGQWRRNLFTRLWQTTKNAPFCTCLIWNGRIEILDLGDSEINN